MGYRYIGTKTRLLDEVLMKISTLAPYGGHVVDLMCGTATVSLALAKKGFRVTAVDVMTYSYHHARVALSFDEYPRFIDADSFISKYAKGEVGYESMLSALSNVPDRKDYFWQEFSSEGNPMNTENPRNYFSPKNAKRIDGMRFWIKKMKQEGMISDLERSLLLHNLIMAVNDVANIAGTYGHYLSSLMGRAKDALVLKMSNIRVDPANKFNRALRGYAEEIAPTLECDVCYIDPPYMKRQYAANYHVLETLAREDNPVAIGVSGLRPWRDQYSNFCTKTKIRDSFRSILEKMECPHFLISYSEDGLLSIDELESVFSEFGTVKVHTMEHKRFKSNDSKLNPKITEYLIHLEKFKTPQTSSRTLCALGAR